jgi:hypothetical protein
LYLDNYYRNYILRGGPGGSVSGRLEALHSVTAELPNGDDDNGANGGETPESAIVYMRSMAEALAKMAQRNGFDTLGYLFEMARLEADRIAHEEDNGQTSDTLPPP